MILPNQVNVLIACEESQAECTAFRDRGFNAYSCDIKPARRGSPLSTHVTCDVTKLFRNDVRFVTDDGHAHRIPRWHLIIAHPPCTYLCKVGSTHMVHSGIVDQTRYSLMLEARKFFFRCLNAPADFLAVENPLPMARARLPKPSCFLHPSWFGVKYTKKTLYWLRNLPPIMAEIDHPAPKSFVHASRGHYRSRTFPQVAQALARQWGDFILDELNELDNSDPKIR